MKWTDDLRAVQSDRHAVGSVCGEHCSVYLPHLEKLAEKQQSYLLCFSDVFLELCVQTDCLKQKEPEK